MRIRIDMIGEWADQFLTAWRFLTVVPSGRDEGLTAERLGKSMLMFPAVGLVLGGILMLLRVFLGSVFPATLVDFMVIAALVLLTGGLHLDGFADVLDGLAGAGDREGALRIMRDSRIGAAGVTGLVLLILLKVIALNQSPEAWKPALVFCMPCVGRWSMLQQAAFSRYAREGEGTGRAFADFAGPREYLWGLLITFTAVAPALGFRGVLVLCLIGLITYLMTRYFARRLGGVTGDTQGFGGELSEGLFLLLGAAFL